MGRGRRRNGHLAPPADFGARLFSGLKADAAMISSDEAGGIRRRRRAYTEMDDLLADDLKQQQDSCSEQASLKNLTKK